ncbi:MAG: FAD-dependent oxidoreductase [Robiginitomaculum sp.]
MKSIAIIGAGIAGLSAARALMGRADVNIFERSETLGGRLETRASGAYQFDCGAQYFTAKSKAFKDFIIPYIESGAVAPWRPRMLGAPSLLGLAPDKFVGAPHMSALAGAMSDGLNLIKDTQITELERIGRLWYLTDQRGDLWGKYDAVILAVAPKETRAILPKKFKQRGALKRVEMGLSLTLMLGFKGPWAGEWDALMPSGNGVIGWAAINSAKPGRAGKNTSIIVQSTSEFARESIGQDKAKTISALAHQLSEIGGVDSRLAAHKSLHIWGEAKVITPAGHDCLSDPDQGLYACGDWCIKARVEAAFISGQAAAKAALQPKVKQRIVKTAFMDRPRA